MTTDIADIIAGELKVSRSTAYDLMREALKEASPLQEPVATVQSLHMDGKDIGVQAHLHQHLPVGTKLYTTPPAAQPAPVQEPWESEMRTELAALGFDTQCPESIGITLKRWRDGYAAAQPAPVQEPK